MLERAEADVSVSLDQIRGTVKVAAFQTAALTFLPRMTLELQELHPELSIEFHQGEPEVTLPALNSGEYDVVITEAYPGFPAPSLPGIAYQPLFEDALWLAVNAELASILDPTTGLIRQLAGTGWAVEALDSVPRTWVINECRKNGFEPRIVCSTEDLAVQRRFVEAGLAVAVLPGLALEEGSPNIRRFPTGLGIQNREILAAYRKASEKRPALGAVLSAFHRESAKY
ncbi:LysR substrate-binding domain-containing protein [Paenarthrobacter sp. AB444]|uniref:LysR substrate-binding domain-containing protein n=1 Tax=Paenarthrobacter sp. AB444 TaxID=3025681 RepID=UPI0023659592|nr:LysR substrate-binding domain-containing protein [Paenarthrobacter sp. AB444]MDD7833881.1 LysR substrate-binding domain-containing protein [Paenarthrobacter sp. AB444]